MSTVAPGKKRDPVPNYKMEFGVIELLKLPEGLKEDSSDTGLLGKIPYNAEQEGKFEVKYRHSYYYLQNMVDY